jgi:ribosomal protein L20A (L18A)
MVCYHVNETLPIINYGDKRRGKEMKQKFIPNCQKNNPKEATSRILRLLASKIKCKFPTGVSKL